MSVISTQKARFMSEQQRQTLSRALFILSGVIIVTMIGLGILGMFNEPSQPTPPTDNIIQELPDTPSSSETTPSTQNNDSGLFGQIWGFIVSIWNFVGRVGLIAQLLCCIGVPLLILAGIATDKPL